MKYHIKNAKFVVDGHRGSASLRNLLKWQFGGGRVKWPTHVENQRYPAPPRKVDGDTLLATWIGHSTVLLQTSGLNILTDPFFSKRASPSQIVGPARVRGAGVAMADLPPIDLILLSHNHYDHMDRSALKNLASAHRPLVLTPLKNGTYVPSVLMQEMDWRATIEFKNLKVTLMPALHWSKRSFNDTNHALWGAFVIQTQTGVIYFAGDTGYGNGSAFREVKARFGPPRLALLPIGAYEPRWFMKPQHMNPQEAVQAHLDLGSQTSLAIHHSTIQLTDEAIDAPLIALQAALQSVDAGPTSFVACEVGETLRVT